MRRAIALFHPDSSGLGGDDLPIPMAETSEPSSKINTAPGIRPVGKEEAKPKIRAFASRLEGGEHKEKWARPPNVNGTGSSHVKSFHCKLNAEGLENMDSMINEWLSNHPECEVKLVTSTVGEWTGKTKDPNLVVQVWV